MMLKKLKKLKRDFPLRRRLLWRERGVVVPLPQPLSQRERGERSAYSIGRLPLIASASTALLTYSR